MKPWKCWTENTHWAVTWFILAVAILITYGVLTHEPTLTTTTTHADCTHMAELHEKEVERLLDRTLNLQTELIMAQEELKIREQLDMDGFVESEK